MLFDLSCVSVRVRARTFVRFRSDVEGERKDARARSENVTITSSVFFVLIRSDASESLLAISPSPLLRFETRKCGEKKKNLCG